jgi:hypothetical protein
MCQENEWEFLRGQKTFKWYGQDGKCDHAIKIPGCRYEIGINTSPKGEVRVDLDFFDSQLANAVGEKGWKFEMEYDVTKAKMAADAHNHSYHEETLKNGEKVLYVHQGQSEWSSGGEASTQWGGGSQW